MTDVPIIRTHHFSDTKLMIRRASFRPGSVSCIFLAITDSKLMNDAVRSLQLINVSIIQFLSPRH